MAIGDFRAEMTGQVTGAFVTYLRPAVGVEGAGFFIQAEQDGPAIFVGVDPTTLSPVPAVGDEVELTVDAAELRSDVPLVTAISGFSVISSGNDLSGLLQDVGAVDIVAALADFDSELITLSGTVAGEFRFAGTGFMSAKLTTAGVPDSEDLLLRLPETLAATLSLTPGCEIVLPGTPLWRFRDDAQPSAWVAADITVTSCAQPMVTGAIAISDTELVLTFDRPVDPASITNATMQFTVDNGLTVSAAAVAGNEVTLTTSTQAGGTAYTVTVANTVLDDLGSAVDPNGNTAAFTGFIALATLVINEFNTQITNGCDLVEIRATEGGSVEGMVIRYQTADAFVFPAMTVAKNDFIVVHFDGDDEKCSNDNPKPADETQSVSEVPAGATNRNFDNAYDVYASPTGLSGATGVLSIEDSTGTILDAVVYADLGAGNASGGTVSAANAAIAAGQWFDAAGAVLSPYPTGTPDARADAVTDVDTSTSNYMDVAGLSVGRSDDTDSNNTVGWTDASIQSWGEKNPGQSDL